MKKAERNQVPFVTGFNTEYRVLEGIVKRNWSIICNDPHLSKILPSKPKLIYRKARRIKDGIVKNVPDPPKLIATFFDQKGFSKCGKCKPCRTTKKGTKETMEFQSNTTMLKYNIEKLITCCSTHSTYWNVAVGCSTWGEQQENSPLG